MKINCSDKIVSVIRISLGWICLYAGATKLFDPDWSSAGYLKSAESFSSFFGWLASPEVLPVVDFMNEWGLTLLGISLILGLFVRLSSYLGAALMILYYLPVLAFPYAGAHSFLIDDHIIYALVFLLLAELRAGRTFGLDTKFRKTDFARKYKGLSNLLS